MKIDATVDNVLSNYKSYEVTVAAAGNRYVACCYYLSPISFLPDNREPPSKDPRKADERGSDGI